VLAVERGEPKIVVVGQFRVSRQTLHAWLARFAQDGLAGLIDLTHRPDTCPHQAGAEVEASVRSALVRSVNTFPIASSFPGINPGWERGQ
jgi:hypothetical protein